MEPYGISILIRTFNSARTLDRVLSGIELTPADEYVIVDSGSTDATLSIAAERGARIVHAPPPFSYSKSLNLGFQAARNPWVHVISSHSIPTAPQFLEIIRSAAREFPAQVVAGYGPNTFDGKKAYNDETIRYFTRETYRQVEAICGNGNALYRRSAWQEVPFDETIRTAEDRAWLDAIMARGFQIALIPRALTINLTKYSLRYMFRKGYSDALAGMPQPQTLRDLALGFSSLTKRYLYGKMPLGTLLRRWAQTLGSYYGSQRPRDNTPWK